MHLFIETTGDSRHKHENKYKALFKRAAQVKHKPAQTAITRNWYPLGDEQ